jgi:hypothetical protein
MLDELNGKVAEVKAEKPTEKKAQPKKPVAKKPNGKKAVKKGYGNSAKGVISKNGKAAKKRTIHKADAKVLAGKVQKAEKMTALVRRLLGKGKPKNNYHWSCVLQRKRFGQERREVGRGQGTVYHSSCNKR